jgi:uncharacterized phage-associated protein
MANVHDVVKYILKRRGATSAMKLQKLLYYSQAWSLAWEERPLFRARIEAWANGPVIPEVWRHHRGKFQIASWPLGDADALLPKEKQTIDAVLKFYGHRSPQWLSDLTHMEAPWQNARKGLKPGRPGVGEISLDSMSEYYSSLR